MKTEIQLDSRRVILAVRRGNFTALRRAGAYVRKAARHRVSVSPKASVPEQPPHSRFGLLKRSLLFGVEKRREAVVIGPAASLIGPAMTAHEFGGKFRGRRYPKRPLMGPTLNRTKDKLPSLWRDAVK